MTVEEKMAELVDRYGPWTYDIPLGNGVWTRGEDLPHTRLKRTLQMIQDQMPIADSRILDLGCLDGIFSIECALQGAEVVGVDAREENIAKCEFAKTTLGLERLSFVQDDVRNLGRESYGTFDTVICSGLLYHPDAPDVFALLEAMHDVTRRLVVIDTHVSLTPTTTVTYSGQEYAGHFYDEGDASSTWASYGNSRSFWLTRPSLTNAVAAVGFSSSYECLHPAHLNFGKPGLEHNDRCAFVAVRGDPVALTTSPAANTLVERWPEGALAYSAKKRSLISRLRS